MIAFLEQVFFIGKGLIYTLELLVGALCIGVSVGILVAILRYRGFGVIFINRIISLIRGTPLILQLALIYFSIPSLTGIRLSIMSAGILAFGLNSCAYIAEILRAGLSSLPKGQFEAAQTLQIPTYFMWKDLILPQVIRAILPAMTNEAIALLKETALIATIGGMDLMRLAQIMSAERFTYFMPLCIAGGYYYGLVLLIEYVGKKLERKGALC